MKGASDVFIEVGQKYKIKPEVLIAIAQADSSLGKHLKTPYNIGNVGNNDRGDTVSYSNLREGIEAMGMVLNNQYLGDHQTIGELSGGGRAVLGLRPCTDRAVKCYATSQYNWNKNVLASLRVMLGDPNITEEFEFRLN